MKTTTTTEKAARYYCPNCSDPWGDGYRTDEPTVRGDEETGWQCDICRCHTYAPEDDLCTPT